MTILSTAVRGSPRRQCSICNTEKEKVIHAFLAAGRTPHFIERSLREMGEPIKAETIRKHRDICLSGNIQNTVLVSALEEKPGQPISENTDFATAIRSEANRLLAAGQLRVTANHGLKAQELLDRRAEKQADRALMVELAALLSGSRGSGPPADLIEADWKDVTPVLESNAG